MAATVLMTIGGLLLVGLAMEWVGRRTFLPRATLLMLLGVCVGPGVLDLVPSAVADQFELVADMALVMVGFLLGGRLTASALREAGRVMLWVSVVAALTAAVLVAGGLWWLGAPPGLAVLLGGIASATAPAATVDTVTESGQGGPFARLLLAIVALDDAWALILFSVGMAVAAALGLEAGVNPVQLVIHDIGGALLVGTMIGLPAAYLTGRVRPGRPMLTEALGVVFLCGGLALWLDVSFLVASMAAGALIANLARHHEYAFHEIENVEGPFMVLFFVLAGASLEFRYLADLGVYGLAYVAARGVGKWLGAWLGGADAAVRRYMGVALFPQAGAALGMALVAASEFPELAPMLLPLVIGTTVVFELAGPVGTRWALRRAARLEE